MSDLLVSGVHNLKVFWPTKSKPSEYVKVSLRVNSDNLFYPYYKSR